MSHSGIPLIMKVMYFDGVIIYLVFVKACETGWRLVGRRSRRHILKSGSFLKVRKLPAVTRQGFSRQYDFQQLDKLDCFRSVNSARQHEKNVI